MGKQYQQAYLTDELVPLCHAFFAHDMYALHENNAYATTSSSNVWAQSTMTKKSRRKPELPTLREMRTC